MNSQIQDTVIDAAGPSGLRHGPYFATSSPDTAAAKMGLNFSDFLDCVHCGLCTAACPTYLETGDENNSPRGRIYLMRQVVENRLPLDERIRGALDSCLDCRSCETACPSGVRYGRLIEPFRLHLEESAAAGSRIRDDWFAKAFLFQLFPYTARLQLALAPARIAQRIGLLDLLHWSGAIRWLPGRLARLVEMLPNPLPTAPPLPEFLPAIGPRRARVALFLGCVADAMQRPTHWSTARVLQKNGCDVIIPRGQTCCGAIHFHAGQSKPALQFARQNASALLRQDVDAVIVNVAGCGAMMKDYAHHWQGDDTSGLKAFAGKIRDVSEFLVELGPLRPTRSIKLKAVYHDACHLGHAQKITAAPRKLLAMTPGVTLLETAEPEICCGAAGTYNLQHPEMAGRLGSRKLTNILRTGAEAVITSNVGCILQLRQTAAKLGERLQVFHIMDILDQAYETSRQ